MFFPDQTFLGAVGIDGDGNRRLLGLRAGSPHSADNVRGLIEEVVGRHTGQAPPAVFVVGEWPHLTNGVKERFGRSVMVQRCRYEKHRHALGLLPPALQADLLEALLDAYAQEEVRAVKRSLQRLARSIEADHPDVAEVLHDGLDETLTLRRLGVAEPLRPRAGRAQPAPDA